jgi:hypothetical protein
LATIAECDVAFGHVCVTQKSAPIRQIDGLMTADFFKWGWTILFVRKDGSPWIFAAFIYLNGSHATACLVHAVIPASAEALHNSEAGQ